MKIEFEKSMMSSARRFREKAKVLIQFLSYSPVLPLVKHSHLIQIFVAACIRVYRIVTLLPVALPVPNL